MKKIRAHHIFFFTLLLLIAGIYAGTLVIVSLLHNHPYDPAELFHDDCPACQWNNSNNTIENKCNLIKKILDIYNSTYSLNYISVESVINKLILIKHQTERSPPQYIFYIAYP